MNKTSSSTTIIKNTNAKDNHFNRETEYDNYDSSQYVAMDDLGDNASQYVAPDNLYADDRDTDSETDAYGENTEAAEIYGNAKGKKR